MTRSNSKKRDEELSNKELTKIVNELQQALHFINEKFEEIKCENADLKKTLHEKNKHTQKLEERIINLENSIEKSEKNKIKNNIIITGVQTTKNEDIKQVSQCIIKKICKNIENHQIIAATRKDNNNEKSPIVVKLATEETKNEVIKARKEIGSITTKECGIKGQEREIYLNEELTPYKAALFFKGRELKKKYNYKHIWTRDGNIFLRKTDTSPKLRLNTESDLEKYKQ